MVRGSIAQHLAVIGDVSMMADRIAEAGEAIAMALDQGGRVFACGNGGSAADAQHFVAELVGRFEAERSGLPAMALTVDPSVMTAIGNDYGFDNVFARQVEAMGRAGDVLLAISTSGDSENVIRAIEAAGKIGMLVIALAGRDGGWIGRMVAGAIVVSSPRTARIQEAHGLIIHCLCEVIDAEIAGKKNPQGL